MGGRKLFIMVILAMLQSVAYADYEKGLEAFKKKDFTNAIKYWEQAAQENDPNSMYQLGLIYGSGKYVAQDTDKSYNYFRQASKLGNPDATYALYTISRMANSKLSYSLTILEVAMKQGSQKATTKYRTLQALSNGKFDFDLLVSEQSDLIPFEWDISSAVVDPAVLEKGKEVYGTTCIVCHSTGAAGAPVVGKPEQWSERVKKGREVLFKNAIHGYNAMPPKGGRADLSDKVIKATVLYMLEESKRPERK